MNFTDKDFKVASLPVGTELHCGSAVYTITGLIARGGTAFLYSAVRNGSTGVLAVKEACPFADAGLVRNGLVIEPESASDHKASLRLDQCRDAVRKEKKIGQEIGTYSSRAIPLWDELCVDEITAGALSAKREPGTEHGPGGNIFCVLRDVSRHGSFLSQMIRDRMQAEERFSIREIALIVRHTLEALQTVHRAGYLHGDVSPANLLQETPTNPNADPVGEFFLIDFGCSRKVDPDTGEAHPTDAVFSSPRFSPPELYRGRNVVLTQKSDLYAVGCILLELLELLPPKATANMHALADEDHLMRHGASPAAARQAMELLRGCLRDSVQDRFDLEAALAAANKLCDITDPPKFSLPRNLSVLETWVQGSRRQELQALHAALDSGQNPVYIWGLGGLGKSELARKLAQEREARYNTPAYLITYRDSMRFTLLTLNLDGYSPDGKKEAEVLREKLELLRKYHSHALVVLDNYEPDNRITAAGADPESQKAAARENALFQEFLGSVGQVVITTRSRPLAGDYPELEALTETELLTLFRSIAKNEKAGDEAVLALIRAVDFHPLTVELMAATIQSSWSPLSVSDLLEKGVFRDSGYRAVVSSKDRQAKADRISGHLKALFQVASLSETQKRVMCQASLLPGDGMDAALFWSCEKEEEQTALESLESHSWLRRSDGLLRIHPLVREVVCAELSPSKDDYGAFLDNLLYNLLLLYVDQLDSGFSYGAHDAKKQAALVFLAAAAQNESEYEYHLNAGMSCGGVGLYPEAVTVLEACREKIEHDPSIDADILVTYYTTLGSSYSALGDLHKQLECALKAVEIYEKLLPPNHPNLASSYNNLGSAYGVLGDHKKGLDYLLKAVGILEKVLPPDHPDLATTYSNLGPVYGALGDRQKQLDYALKAVEIREKVLPSNHPDLASSYNNLGTAYGALGDLQKRLDYYRKAVEIFEKALPPDHPNLARSYSNLGVAYGALGDRQKKLEYALKAVEIREKVLPSDHPDLASSYENLSRAYADLGDDENSEKYRLKAAKIRGDQ